jgi:predicted amidohydrolase YtcJ
MGIIAVGQEESITRIRESQLILAMAAIIPGLIDAHIHLQQYAPD